MMAMDGQHDAYLRHCKLFWGANRASNTRVIDIVIYIYIYMCVLWYMIYLCLRGHAHANANA